MWRVQSFYINHSHQILPVRKKLSAVLCQWPDCSPAVNDVQWEQVQSSGKELMSQHFLLEKGLQWFKAISRSIYSTSKSIWGQPESLSNHYSERKSSLKSFYQKVHFPSSHTPIPFSSSLRTQQRALFFFDTNDNKNINKHINSLENGKLRKNNSLSLLFTFIYVTLFIVIFHEIVL